MDEKRNTGKEMIRRIIKYRYENTGFHPGKMYVQKILFISKVMGGGVPYDYSLYTYGPYSREIMNDLDDMEYHGEIEMVWNDRFEGYEIHDKGISFDPDMEFNILNDVLNDLGGKNAKTLELLSTVLYLRDNYTSEDDLFNAVKKVKPMFEDSRIWDTIQEAASFRSDSSRTMADT